MICFRSLCIMLCVVIGAVSYNTVLEASEPSIYSKMLVPSPLGKDRILVLCVPRKSDDEALIHFYNSVDWAEFSERHLTIVEVSKHTVQSVFADNNKAKHEDFSDQLRRKADCKNDLEFILIGKDTGVKARWMHDYTQENLFNHIDAMPMRRYEMRQRKTKN